jgi:hypothetical protein
MVRAHPEFAQHSDRAEPGRASLAQVKKYTLPGQSTENQETFL